MNEKRVLIISQVIPQWYVDILTKALGKEAQIDIITGSNIQGNVIHSPNHDPKSLRSRLISWYKHYQFMMRWVKENKKKSYNLVFAVSNPPINSFIGLKLKKIYNAPFVYMNWDLYPQVIEETIGNPLARIVCKLWHRWNAKHYPKIDNILTIGNVMADSMRRPLNSLIDVSVLPIAVNTEILKPIEKKENPFVTQYGLTNKFVVLYSGKMGMGHNIELILDTAEILRNNDEIQFVFIGFGPKYEVVNKFIKDHQSKNIQLLPLQPDDIFPYSMACGDVGIVTQETRMAHLFMPSKTYSMMACGQAIIGIGTKHDDLHDLITHEGIGISIAEQSASVVARKIEELWRDTEMLEAYQKQSRKIAEEKYSIDVVQQRYAKLFYELLE